jgi:hypothetical protein
MAAVLHTDPFDLARRRARAVARIAADLDLDAQARIRATLPSGDHRRPDVIGGTP